MIIVIINIKNILKNHILKHLNMNFEIIERYLNGLIL